MIHYNTHHFTIRSSSDVTSLISKMEFCKGAKQLVHIEAFMHNTVLVHTLEREIMATFEGIEVVKLHHEDKNASRVTLFTCNDPSRQLDVHAMLAQFEAERLAFKAELKEQKALLLQRFYTDFLCNLPNLYKLRNDLEKQPNATFIVLNIDNFKMVNDFYGFVVGDYIIERFSRSIEAQVTNGTVYRIAGDEFGIITDAPLNFYELKDYLETLSATLSHLKYHYAETEIYVDVTMASSISSDDDAFSKVNMALRYAKEQQLSYWIYEDRMHYSDEYETNLKVATKIRNAIQSSGIVPYFQPIVESQSEKVVKFEVLSRLVDENGTILSPTLFIPIAKTIKVYNLITKSIIDKSFEIFKHNDYAFSINLSIDDIMNQEIYNYILAKLAQSHIGERVVFELLETEQISNYKKVSRFITEVRRYKAQVAIDDFGTGFSNFSYLTKIDPDYIKIDGSLIANIDIDKNAQTVVETIVAFSNKLGIKTIAEFVHSATVLSHVKRLGIDYAQGFHIDKPSPNIPGL